MKLIHLVETEDVLGFRSVYVVLRLWKWEKILAKVVQHRSFWPKVFHLVKPELIGIKREDMYPSPTEEESRRIYKFFTESKEFQTLIKYWNWEIVSLENNLVNMSENADYARGKLWGLQHAIHTIYMVAFYQEELKKITEVPEKEEEDESRIGAIYRNFARMDREALS